MSKNYISTDVNKGAVLQFMKKCKESVTDIHSLVVIKDGEEKVKLAPPPYSLEYKQQLYSLSKGFSATAIGFLFDEGIVDVDEKMVDIFADKAPEKVSENLGKMKLKHVLSMNTGHSDCILGEVRKSRDPVREFLKHEPEYEPGTFFAYNNAATYMISEIVAKYTGMMLYDYLYIKLFKPLGIENAHWDAFADGKSQGAVGLHLSAEDISKLGLLYLNKGTYNGKRILSEKWCELATKAWSDNSANGTPDWCAGYGFQLWINERDGYRADGAYGQISAVIPSCNAVVAIECFSDDMQKEMELLYELAENLIGESAVGETELDEFLNSYNAPTGYVKSDTDIFDKLYKCDENPFGVTFLECSDNTESVDVTFSDGECRQTVKFGKNKFFENKITIKKLKPTLEDLCPCEEKANVHFASFATTENGKLHFNMNYLDNPHTDDFVIEADENRIHIHRAVPYDFSFNGEIFAEEFK